MLAGRVRWSVDTMIRQPAAAAARMFSSNVGSPSEKRVWVWQSTMGRTAAEAFGAATGAIGECAGDMAPPLRGMRMGNCGMSGWFSRVLRSCLTRI